MFDIKSFFRLPCGYYDYIWVDVALIKETPKAILIEFDNRKAWLPKAWIVKIKKCLNCEHSRTVSIKISLYNWSKKFS